MRPQVALPSILIAVLLGLTVLVGCGGGDGGSDESASELIQQTFGSDAQLEQGRVALGLTGDLGGTGKVDIQLQARFAPAPKGQLPLFDGALTFSSDSGTLDAGAISTGDQGYITLAGQAYEVGEADWKSFTDTYLANESEVDQQAQAAPTLESVGIKPQDWLIDPEKAGERELEGERTIHLTAGVDVEKMLADLEKVGARAGEANPLTPELAASVRDGIQSATVDIDTGAEDHRLRRLVIHLQTSSGPVDVTIQYSELGQPQTIEAPADARPVSELTDALEQMAGQTPAPDQGSGAGSGGGGGSEQQYADCVAAAGADVSKLQDCAKYL